MQNPVASPSAAQPGQPAGDPADALFSATAPNTIVKAAAAVQLLTAALAAVTGLQFWMALKFSDDSWYRFLPHALALFGVATAVAASRTYRTRVSGAVLGLTLTSILTLGMGYWVVFSFFSGFFSLLALLVPVCGVAAAIVSGMAIPSCNRAEAARLELRAHGLDMPF